MRSFGLFFGVILIVATNIETAAAQVASLKEHSFRQDGQRRSYLLYTPRGAQQRVGDQPLVIVMHGGGGTHRAMVSFTKRRWNVLANKHGFYVVYPNALEREWDFGEGRTSANRKRRVDDLAYFNRIVDDLSARLPIDENRVFATGHSRGGAASYFLGCKMSHRVTAIAPVSMPLPGYLEDDCMDGEPIGIAIIHGTKDPQVPYDGGYVNVLGAKRDPVLSIDKTLTIWRDRNKCLLASTSTTIIDKPNDETSVKKSEWSDCSGAPVTLYRIENGGHTWPSGKQYLPIKLVGEVSHDIDGADEVWQFFSQFESTGWQGNHVADKSEPDQAGYFKEKLQLPGYPNRPYDVFVPPGLNAPAPVLLALHGGGADASNALKTTCPGGDITHADCITRHATRNGYIVVFPRGTARKLIPKMRSWNAGGGDAAKRWICASGPACEGNVDDVAYFRALLDELEQTVAVDKRRVYATGISNGAAMTHRLACEMSDRIAAIVAIEGANQFSTVGNCAPDRPVPVLQIHGTADCAWPYEGGAPFCKGSPSFDGEYISVDRSNEVWRLINGCIGGPKRSKQKPQFRDGTRVEILDWQGCKVPLVSYRIEGGGHTWPNGFQYLSKRRIGPVTREVSNDDIWAFLAVHTLPLSPSES